MVRAHILGLLATDPALAVRTAERALAYAATENRPAWVLLLGRARIAAGDAARAAADLIALADGSADAALACEALYYAALAHERLDRPDVAETLYRELRNRADLPDSLRARVIEGLNRVD